VNAFLLRIIRGNISLWGILHRVGRAIEAHALVLEGIGASMVVLVVALAVFEVPRRRAQALSRRVLLRPSFARAARHAGMAGADDAGVKVREVRATPAGHRLKVEIPPGSHAGKLEDAAEAIAAAMGVREVRVARDAANAGVAWVSVVRTDTLAGSEPLYWPWLRKEFTSLWEAIPLGIDEDGAPVALRLPWHNMAVGGEPGGGKSGAVNVTVAAAALDPSVRLILLDGKLVELAVWRRCAEACVGVSVADAIDVLKTEQSRMDECYGYLLDSRKRKVEPGDGIPLTMIVIDEQAHYSTSGDSKETKEFNNRLRDLVSRGRAAGVCVVAATQKPASDIIPTSLRDLFGFRLAFRCATPQASDTILGQGWASRGYSAARIDAANRGVGYLLHEGETPVRLRTYYLSDDDLAMLAARAEALRSGAVPVTASVVGGGA
jgi:DNA segregation ATPase FtsK/SpoIIIE-like protein